MSLNLLTEDDFFNATLYRFLKNLDNIEKAEKQTEQIVRQYEQLNKMYAGNEVIHHIVVEQIKENLVEFEGNQQLIEKLRDKNEELKKNMIDYLLLVSPKKIFFNYPITLSNGSIYMAHYHFSIDDENALVFQEVNE